MNTTFYQLNHHFFPNKKLCRSNCDILENRLLLSFDTWAFADGIFQQHSLKFDSMKEYWTIIRHISKNVVGLIYSGNCHSHSETCALYVGAVSNYNKCVRNS